MDAPVQAGKQETVESTVEEPASVEETAIAEVAGDEEKEEGPAASSLPDEESDVAVTAEKVVVPPPEQPAESLSPLARARKVQGPGLKIKGQLDLADPKEEEGWADVACCARKICGGR